MGNSFKPIIGCIPNLTGFSITPTSEEFGKTKKLAYQSHALTSPNMNWVGR